MPLVDDKPITPLAPSNGDESERLQAIRQIQRRRHFHVEAVASAIGMAVLVLIWGFSEYHNAGGWPTEGFSQSSGIHDVWNYWIVYPLGAWLLILGARAWMVYGHGHKPISEAEIEKEIERQSGPH
jgi:2TM domain